MLRYAIIHLPNGQVMMTFVDVTDSVNVERALKDKNEALQKSDQLKNDFVQHVSYELRSPLTNIIGFTELLRLPDTGPLTPRQREYVDHIGSSSSVLLTIVNDILDLATVDAGIMQLEIARGATSSRPSPTPSNWSRTGCSEHAIALRIEPSRAPKSFHGDETPRPPDPVQSAEQRRQLRAGGQRDRADLPRRAKAASNSRCTTTVRACRPKCSTRVFRRFEPRTNGGRRRGAGLGLAIVKSFVELHGGTVEIDSGAGQGHDRYLPVSVGTGRRRRAAAAE